VGHVEETAAFDDPRGVLGPLLGPTHVSQQLSGTFEALPQRLRRSALVVAIVPGSLAADQVTVPTAQGQSVTVSWTGTVLPGANPGSDCSGAALATVPTSTVPKSYELSGFERHLRKALGNARRCG